MLKRLWAVGLAIGLVAGGAGAADEAVTIKLKKPGKGDVVKETKTEVVTSVTELTMGGQTKSQEEKGGSKLVYTDEILDKGEKDSKATRLKRTYETAELTRKGEQADLGLKGKTVLITKEKDQYTFKLDGEGALTGEAKELLDKEFNKKDEPDVEELMVPKKPVKVGDTWEVDAKAVEKMFGEELTVNKDKVKVTGKLMKVYDKDKAKFGVVDYTIELPIKAINSPMGALDVEAGSKLKVNITLDGCIDGTQFAGSSTGKMEGNVGLKVPGVEVAVKMSGTMSSKSEPVKK